MTPSISWTSSRRRYDGWELYGPAPKRLINRSQIYVLPLSSYDVKATRAEARIPSDVVTAIAFRKDHPGSYIGSTTLGIAFVNEKNGAIQMLKRKRTGSPVILASKDANLRW